MKWTLRRRPQQVPVAPTPAPTFPDVYNVTWPFQVDPCAANSVIPRYAVCLDEESAEQVRKGLAAIGYSQAVVYATGGVA